MDQKEDARPRGTDSAETILVIKTRALEGRGTEDDPARTVTQYWTLDGKLIAAI